MIGNKFYTKSDPILPGRVSGPPVTPHCWAATLVTHLSWYSSLCMLFAEPRVGKVRVGRLKENSRAIGTAHSVFSLAGTAALQQTCCILLCLTQECSQNAAIMWPQGLFRWSLYVYRTKVAPWPGSASSHTCNSAMVPACYIIMYLQNMG